MSEGAWLTIAISVGGGFATLITALITSPRKSNGIPVPDFEKCPAHSGIVANINSLSEGISRVEDSQTETWEAIIEIQRDIKELLQR